MFTNTVPVFAQPPYPEFYIATPDFDNNQQRHEFCKNPCHLQGPPTRNGIPQYPVPIIALPGL